MRTNRRALWEPEEGYEVTHACQVDPEAGDLVERGCLELLVGLSES